MICRNHPEAFENITRCSRCLGPFCHDCIVLIGRRPYCANCKLEQVLDVQSGVDPTTFDLASIGRRFVALLLDGLVIMVPAVIVMGVAFAVLVPAMVASRGEADPTATPLFLVVQCLTVLIILGGQIAYEGLMLQSRGQTLGKMAMKIKVVGADGFDITTGQAWGRTAMKAFTSQVCSGLLFAVAFFNEDKACVHDMVAKTRVVNWG